MGETQGSDRRHQVSRLVEAAADQIFEAFVDPKRLVAWLPPQGAKAEIEYFDPAVGGKFKAILTFSAAIGKSSRDSDLVEGRFLELLPGKRMTYTVDFSSDRPEFAGSMTMTWSLSPARGGTLVTIMAEEAPTGISREDHERGMASTLENLARFVAQR